MKCRYIPFEGIGHGREQVRRQLSSLAQGERPTRWPAMRLCRARWCKRADAARPVGSWSRLRTGRWITTVPASAHATGHVPYQALTAGAPPRARPSREACEIRPAAVLRLNGPGQMRSVSIWKPCENKVLSSSCTCVRWTCRWTRPYAIQTAVDKLGAKRVILDSISGLEAALAPAFKDDFLESLYRLLGALTGVGVTISANGGSHRVLQ